MTYYIQYLDTLDFDTIDTEQELESEKVYDLEDGRSILVIDTFEDIDSLTESVSENFKINKELNQDLFDGDKLKGEVKDRLIEIADTFVDSIREKKIPVKVYDYWLVGSNASYNYTDKSDIDVHVIVDMNVDVDSYLLRLLYDYIKSSFNDKFDIKVKGHEVELYLEDVKTSAVTNGIYSLTRDEWIKKPEPMEEREIDIEGTDLYKAWKERYESLSESDIEKFIDDLYLLRKESLITDGEFGDGNLLFKQLRNEGILDELKDRLYKKKSDELTLENLNEEKQFVAYYSDGPLSDRREKEIITADNLDGATQKAINSTNAKHYDNVTVKELKDGVNGYTVFALADLYKDGKKYDSNIEKYLTFKAENESQARSYYIKNYLGKYYLGDYVRQSNKDRFTDKLPTSGYAVKFSRIVDVYQSATNPEIVNKYEDATK